MKHGYIYKITIGPNYYFGQTRNPKRRKAEHWRRLKRNRHPSEYMQNSYNKYKEYEFSVIEKVAEDFLGEVEKRYIDSSLGDKRCMNVRAEMGGGGFLHAESTKRKISRKLMGHSLSRDTRDKISAANRGKKIPKETIEKMVRTRKATYGGHSKETRERMSAARRNTVNRVYVLVSPDGERHRFPTLAEAAAFFGFHEKSLSPYFAGVRPWPSKRKRTPLFGWTGYCE